MEDKIITMEMLHKMTEQLIEAGYGKMKLTVGDSYVYDCDISRAYGEDNPRLEIHEYLVSRDMIMRVNNFINKVQEAKEELYGGEIICFQI